MDGSVVLRWYARAEVNDQGVWRSGAHAHGLTLPHGHAQWWLWLRVIDEQDEHGHGGAAR